MKSFSTQCIILGHKNFGEADKLIFLYTEEFGKIKAVAKGARRITSKFTGHLETLNIANISLYFGPGRTILTEVITTKSFKKIRENLEKLNSALLIAEVTNNLTYENQCHENLLILLEKTLRHLSQSKKSSLITYTYIFKLLDIIGIIPDFKETENNLQLKYVKFFEFIKKKTLPEVEKIKLTQIEEKDINEVIQRILNDYLKQSSLATLITP